MKRVIPSTKRILTEYQVPKARILHKDTEVGMWFLVELARASIVSTADSGGGGGSGKPARKSVSKIQGAAIPCKEKQDRAPTPLQESAETVQKFITDNIPLFAKACTTQFPFSTLDLGHAKTALNRSLKNQSSIYLEFLASCKEADLTAENFSNDFGPTFDSLHGKELGEVCDNLLQSYETDNNTPSGYFLLWIISHQCFDNKTILPYEEFKKTKLSPILSTYFESTENFFNADKFVDIFLYKCNEGHPYNYGRLLSEKLHNNCINLIIHVLCVLSKDIWPWKGHHITSLFKILTSESKLAVANKLSTSEDDWTSTLAKHYKNILESKNFTTAIPHLYLLQESLPHIGESHMNICFGYPWIPFRKNSDYHTRLLNFNGLRRGVFLYNDLMIGMYRSNSYNSTEKIPPYLLAFEQTTERVAWGIPLGTPRNYVIDQLENGLLSLQFYNEKTIAIIDPKDGSLLQKIQLLHSAKNKFDKVYISRTKVVYQVTIHPAFEIETPRGFPLPLSTHYAFHRCRENIITIFNALGKSVTLPCISAFAKGTKLYMVEPNKKDPNSCQLTVRRLKEEEGVVSQAEQTLPLPLIEEKTKILELCKNNHLILSTEKTGHIIFLSINLSNEKIYEMPHKAKKDAKYTINGSTGEVWTWDPYTNKKVHKISPTENKEMGTVDASTSTALVHADQDRLFF